MSRELPVNVEVVDQFPVFEPDNFTKHSGLSGGDFAVTIWHDGSVKTGYPYTIAEIGTDGEYQFRFTPDAIGFWLVEVAVDYSLQIEGGEYDIGEASTSTLYALLRRALGRIGENILIDETEFDINGQMTNCRFRAFESKADTEAATDGGTSPPDPTPIATWTLETVWEGINEIKTTRQVLEP